MCHFHTRAPLTRLGLPVHPVRQPTPKNSTVRGGPVSSHPAHPGGVGGGIWWKSPPEDSKAASTRFPWGRPGKASRGRVAGRDRRAGIRLRAPPEGGR